MLLLPFKTAKAVVSESKAITYPPVQFLEASSTLAQARIDMILRIAQAYFDVLNTEENLLAVQANKVFIAEQLKQAQKNFEFGTVTITDTHEAQARYDLAVAQEIAAGSERRIKRAALRRITGKEPGVLYRLRTQAVLAPPQPTHLERWEAAAETNNFAVLIQRAALEIAEKEVNKNRAGHYPTLDIVASYGNTASGVTQYVDSRTDVRSRNVGVQINIPIYQGGATNSKTREAIANRDAAVALLDGARRTAVLSVNESFLGAENGIVQVRALEAALVSGTSALESNKVGYKVGVRINIDVLNAEQQVYSTRRDLAKARFETLLAQLKLKAAAGSLGEDDLRQLGVLFEEPTGKVETPSLAFLQSSVGKIAHGTTQADSLKKPNIAAAAMPTTPATGTILDKENARREVELFVKAWAKSWSDRRAEDYLSHYGRNFLPAGRMTRASWEAQRRERISRARDLRVEVDLLEVVNLTANTVEVQFRQHYSSRDLTETSSKRLILESINGRWQILREQSPIPPTLELFRHRSAGFLRPLTDPAD